MFPSRHNVELSADLYLPRAEGPYPVVMTITPYDQDAPELKGAGDFDRGEPVNRGTHTLHFGADRASHLLVPYIGAD